MTTIATDGNSVSGDGQVTNDNLIEALDFIKVKRIEGGKRHIKPSGFGAAKMLDCPAGIIAFTGEPAQFSLFEKLIDTGTIPDGLNMAKSEAIFVTDDGIFSYDENLVPVKVDAPFAMGTGGQIALGAMMAGKTTEHAVRIACNFDVFSGGKITTLTLEPSK